MNSVGTKSRTIPRSATAVVLQQEAAEAVNSATIVLRTALDRAYHLGLVVNLHISGSAEGEDTIMIPDMQVRDMQPSTYKELSNA